MTITRKIRLYVLVALGLLGFKLFFDWWTYSGPEYHAVITFMKQNSVVTDLYGAIQSYSSDDIGSQVEWRGNGLNLNNGEYLGTNKFDVVGTKESGTISIKWVSDSKHNITFTEITATPDGETQRILWTAK